MTNTPAVTRIGDWQLEVFVRWSDGSLRHRWRLPSGSWEGWQSLGGCITDSPAIAHISTDRLEVFARGCDGQLMHLWHKADRSWSDWHSLGGCITGSPAVGQLPNGAFEVFARGCTGTLQHLWQRDDRSWTEWFPVDEDPIVGSPSVLAQREGTLRVVATLASWTYLTTGARDPVTGSWSWWHLGPFRPLGEKAALADNGGFNIFNRVGPALPSVSDPYPDILYLASEYPVNLGGSVTNDPAVGVLTNNQLAVFARGADGTLQVDVQSGPYWEGWQSLGGQMTDSPAVVNLPDGRLEVFARWTDGSLRHLWQQ